MGIEMEAIASLEKKSGLFLRVHTDVRAFRSRFADSGNGTLSGLFAAEGAQVKGGKDRFYEIDNGCYDDPLKRDLLNKLLKKAHLAADSQAIKQKIEKFFETSRELKNKARIDNPSGEITMAQAVQLQNQINEHAVRTGCIHLSLIRQDTDAEFPGSKYSKTYSTNRKEVKLAKVYVPEDTEVDQALIERILREVKDIEFTAETSFVLLEKTETIGGQPRKATRVERKTVTNSQELGFQQATTSAISKDTSSGYGTKPRTASDWMSKIGAATSTMSGTSDEQSSDNTV